MMIMMVMMMVVMIKEKQEVNILLRHDTYYSEMIKKYLTVTHPVTQMI